MSRRVVAFQGRCFVRGARGIAAPRPVGLALLAALAWCTAGTIHCPLARAQADAVGDDAQESAARWGQIRGAAIDQATTAPGSIAAAAESPPPTWSLPPHGTPGPADRAGAFSGLAQPLAGTSWLNRPFHAGWMVGGLLADDLMDGSVEQRDSLTGGYRLGWDFHDHWGMEGRFLFSNVDIQETGNAAATGICHHRYWDVDLVYYPWGDSRWRPFVSLGVGWATFDSRAAFGRELDGTLMTLPLGAGVKYYYRNWLALRFSAVDNWALGREALSTMHNVSLTGDVEVRFGGRRPSYFPYHGGLFVW